MASVATPVCQFGRPAVDFALPDVDGRIWTLASSRGSRGLLVMFVCNHCPYVKAIWDRLVRDARELQATGVGCVAIMSNDPTRYAEDSIGDMARIARDLEFPFPYLIDASQEVARAYGAICTPDFFGYNAGLTLQYRGRLDASGRQPAPPDARRELFEAMTQIAETGAGPVSQVASMGCSIKWRE